MIITLLSFPAHLMESLTMEDVSDLCETLSSGRISSCCCSPLNVKTLPVVADLGVPPVEPPPLPPTMLWRGGFHRDS